MGGPQPFLMLLLIRKMELNRPEMPANVELSRPKWNEFKSQVRKRKSNDLNESELNRPEETQKLNELS